MQHFVFIYHFATAWPAGCRRTVSMLAVTALFVLSGCGGPPQTTQSDTAQTETASPAALDTDTVPRIPTTAPPNAAINSQKILSNMGFKTPESVYYDANQDLYLVSNINGSPFQKDNNGFISKLSPDGQLIKRRWIAGNQNGVTLHAPKGMTICDGLLHVTDIDVIRIFDPKSGEIKGKIAIPNASFLNDLTTSADNTLYVSDTGWTTGPDGFAATGSDSVWRIRNGNATQLTDSKKIPSPNGLLAIEAGVLVVNSLGNLYKIDQNGAPKKIASLPGKRLDGIARTAAGKVLISSWDSRTVYEAGADKRFVPLVTDVTSPADIGVDFKRHRLLIPVFQHNEVRIIPLSDKSL